MQTKDKMKCFEIGGHIIGSIKHSEYVNLLVWQ